MKTAPDLIREVYEIGAYFTRADCGGFDIRGYGRQDLGVLDGLEDNVDNVVRVLLGEYYAGSTLDLYQ